MRQLVRMYDVRLLERWDHTAIVAGHIYTLTAKVHNALSKTKIKPKPLLDFNPYRAPQRSGLKITQGNFGLLREAVGAIAGGRTR